jgi:uncharacterized RDD family membrane protein YckC
MRRLFAFAIDWLVIVAWGALLFAIVWFGNDRRLPNAVDPWFAQAVGLVTMTVPVALYFALTESSRAQASLGKRLLGLRVADDAGQRLPLARSLLRNAIKFVPWECGHAVADHAVASGDGGPALWLYAPMAVALLVPLWWVGALLATGRTPYDRWAGARVS